MTMKEPTLAWQAQVVDLINNGHTVQLTAKDAAPGGRSYEIAGTMKAYTLVQCHLHFGAEHTIGGRQPPFEAHCMHTLDGEPRYGVSGILYMTGGHEERVPGPLRGPPGDTHLQRE